MATITIGSVDYDVYTTVATADEYLAADIELGSTWSSATEATKQQALVSATRYIDRQQWSGQKTVSSQALDWPRTGATGATDGVIPQEILDASIVLAGMFVVDSTTQSTADQSQTQKRVKAGSAEVEFFFKSRRNSTKFPARVNDLIAEFLGGSSVSAGFSCTGVSSSDWEGDPFGVNQVF